MKAAGSLCKAMGKELIEQMNVLQKIRGEIIHLPIKGTIGFLVGTHYKSRYVR